MITDFISWVPGVIAALLGSLLLVAIILILRSAASTDDPAQKANEKISGEGSSLPLTKGPAWIKAMLLPLVALGLIGGVVVWMALYKSSFIPFLFLVLPFLWHYTNLRTQREEQFWGIKWREGERLLPASLVLQYLFQVLFGAGMLLLLLLRGPEYLSSSLVGSVLYLIFGFVIIFTSWFFDGWGGFTRLMISLFGLSLVVLWSFGRILTAKSDYATIAVWQAKILSLERLFTF